MGSLSTLLTYTRHCIDTANRRYVPGQSYKTSCVRGPVNASMHCAMLVTNARQRAKAGSGEELMLAHQIEIP